MRFAAPLAPDEEALVYTSGSAFRPDVSGPGYWVFAPARLAGGGVVIVNRGFVPEGRQDKATRAGRRTSRVRDGRRHALAGTPGWFMPQRRSRP